MPVTNTLAYFTGASLTNKERFFLLRLPLQVSISAKRNETCSDFLTVRRRRWVTPPTRRHPTASRHPTRRLWPTRQETESAADRGNTRRKSLFRPSTFSSGTCCTTGTTTRAWSAGSTSLSASSGSTTPTTLLAPGADVIKLFSLSLSSLTMWRNKRVFVLA